MNGTAIHFHAPKTITSMCEAFAEHCEAGGGDFVEYLKDWNMADALVTINDVAQRYQPEAAIEHIKKALEELFEIAAQGHRQQLEADELGGD